MTSLRPAIPPWSLHHLENATAASYISLLSPARPSKPLSVTVPTWMSVAVTALSLAVSVVPDGAGAHTSLMSPTPPLATAVRSLPPLDADDDPLLVLELDASLLLSLRPHAARRKTRTVATAAALVYLTDGPPMVVRLGPPRTRAEPENLLFLTRRGRRTRAPLRGLRADQRSRP